MNDQSLRVCNRPSGNKVKKDLKYEFTEATKEVNGHILHQIRNLNTGALGGWIEKEENLSQTRGDAWVSGNACVYGNARVYGNAKVFDNAEIYEDAQIGNRAKVYGNAKVHGETCVNGDAEVFGNADITSDVTISENLRLAGSWEEFINNLWVGAPFADYKGMVNNRQLQKMLDFVSADHTRTLIFCSLIHGRDGGAIRRILFNDAYYEAFDRYDSDVGEKFIWYYRNFKSVIFEDESRGF